MARENTKRSILGSLLSPFKARTASEASSSKSSLGILSAMTSSSTPSNNPGSNSMAQLNSTSKASSKNDDSGPEVYKGKRSLRSVPSPLSSTAGADQELLHHMEEAERYYKMDPIQRFQAASSLEGYRRALMLYHDPRAQHLAQASHHWDMPLTEEQRIAIAMLPIRNSLKGKPSEAKNNEYGFLQHVTRYLSLALAQPGMGDTSYAQEAVELGNLQADSSYTMQGYVGVQMDRVLLLGKHLSSLYGIDRNSTHGVYSGPNKSRVHFYDGATDPLDIWIPEAQAHSYPFENGRYFLNLEKVAAGRQHIEHLRVLRELLEEDNPLGDLNGEHVALGISTYKKLFRIDDPTNVTGMGYPEAKGRGFAEHLLRAHLIPLGDFETLGAFTEEYNMEWALAAMEWSPLIGETGGEKQGSSSDSPAGSKEDEASSHSSSSDTSSSVENQSSPRDSLDDGDAEDTSPWSSEDDDMPF